MYWKSWTGTLCRLVRDDPICRGQTGPRAVAITVAPPVAVLDPVAE